MFAQVRAQCANWCTSLCNNHRTGQHQRFHFPILPSRSRASAARLKAMRCAFGLPSEMQPRSQYIRHRLSVTHAVSGGICSEAGGRTPSRAIASIKSSRARAFGFLLAHTCSPRSDNHLSFAKVMTAGSKSARLSGVRSRLLVKDSLKAISASRRSIRSRSATASSCHSRALLP